MSECLAGSGILQVLDEGNLEAIWRFLGNRLTPLISGIALLYALNQLIYDIAVANNSLDTPL